MTANIEIVSGKTNEQSEQMKVVLEKAQSIAAVSEQSAAATEQVSASVEEQSAQISEINTSSKMLTELSEDLQKSLSKFKFSSTKISKDTKNEESDIASTSTVPIVQVASVPKQKVIKT